MSLTIKGRKEVILGKEYFIASEPSHKVVKYVTDEEFDRNSKNIMNRYMVRESLTLLDGSKLVVNYIKRSS